MDNSITSEQTGGSRAGFRVFRLIRTIFIYLLSAAIIIAALLFASSATPDKSLFGYRYYTVLTPSMEPAYSVGDMVFVKIENADNINVGDVITFNPSSYSDAYLTHRVVEKIPDYQGSGVTCFRTKGDANDSEDSFLIDEGRVIGTVKLGISKLGYVVRFVQLRWYFVVPIIILIFVFFKLIGIYLGPAKKKDSEDDAEQIEGEAEGDASDKKELAEKTAPKEEAGAETAAAQNKADSENSSVAGEDKEDIKSE